MFFQMGNRVSRFSDGVSYVCCAPMSRVSVLWALHMQQNVLQGLRGAVKEELKPLREDLEKVKKSVAGVEGRVAFVEDEMKGRKSVDEDLDKRLKEMENNLSAVDGKITEEYTAILVGGLQSMAFEEAHNWVKRTIKEKNLQEPTVVYHKGDVFTGIAFAEFSSSKGAEDAVKKISVAKLKVGDDEIWCKKDLPLHKRVALSFLLGLRRQLIEWGFSRSKVRVKEEDHTLVVGGMTILKAEVKDNQLDLNWKADEWKSWADLVDSTEFRKLQDKVEETLKKAGDEKGSGEGKGKKGH